MRAAMQWLSLPWNSARLPGFCAALHSLAQSQPGCAAAVAAALVMSVAVLTGADGPLERRLSDAWFCLASVAPSGRTVLVTFDHAGSPDAAGMRVSRRDLADLLLQLDAAGASRILVEVGLAEPSNAADDSALERVLAKLGRKVALTASAVKAANQTGWRRTVVMDRFARHVARAASDLALDPDGAIRSSGIEDSDLPYLISGPAWLNGGRPARRGGSAAFRIDFGIDLGAIPTLEARSVLRGRTDGLAGAGVIVAGYTAAGRGLHVPRYSEVTRAQVTALAAETLAQGRTSQTAPRGLSGIALIAIAALMALACVHCGALTAAGLCAAIVVGAMGVGYALQNYAGVIAPAVGIAVAALLGYAGAQVMTHPAFRRVRQAIMTMLKDIDVDGLSRIATEDALTGVANRRAFEQRLRQTYAGSDWQFALFLCDLDGFKQVNDTLGHKAGDALLREIAKRLVGETPPSGVVARLGGDEFAILMPQLTQPLAAQAAGRLVDAVKQPIDLDGRPANVGISIGIAFGEQHRTDHALLESADAAMYAAKRSRTGFAFANVQREDAPLENAPAADLRGTGRLVARVS